MTPKANRAVRRAACTPVHGFSLIEVIAAIALFAFGVTTLIGLLTASVASTGSTTDASVAAHLGDLIRIELQTRVARARSLEPVNVLLRAPASPFGDPRTDSQLLFASRDGTTVGSYADPVWDDHIRERHFVIELVRLDLGGPANEGSESPFAANYFAVVRWPAFGPETDSTQPERIKPALRGQQEAVLLTGVITR